MNAFGWQQVLERAYGLRTWFLLAREGGRVRGVLPCYAPRRRGRRMYALRYGLAADDAEVAEALVRAALRHGKDDGRDLLVASSDAPWAGRAPAWSKQTLLLPVAPTEEETWDALGNKARNLVRKGERSGLRASTGPEAMAGFYGVYAAGLLRKGLPPHSAAFFQAMAGAFGDRCLFLTAEADGRVEAGLVALFAGPRAVYPFAGFSPEGRDRGAGPFLMWRLLQHCRARGVRVLDMGESTEGGGVHRFKENLGGIPTPVAYHVLGGAGTAPGGGSETAAPSMASRLAGLVLRAAPLPVALRVGRHMKVRGRVV